jgi:hypothetical protein
MEAERWAVVPVLQKRFVPMSYYDTKPFYQHSQSMQQHSRRSPPLPPPNRGQYQQTPTYLGPPAPREPSKSTPGGASINLEGTATRRHGRRAASFSSARIQDDGKLATLKEKYEAPKNLLSTLVKTEGDILGLIQVSAYIRRPSYARMAVLTKALCYLDAESDKANLQRASPTATLPAASETPASLQPPILLYSTRLVCHW